MWNSLALSQTLAKLQDHTYSALVCHTDCQSISQFLLVPNYLTQHISKGVQKRGLQAALLYQETELMRTINTTWHCQWCHDANPNIIKSHKIIKRHMFLIPKKISERNATDRKQHLQKWTLKLTAYAAVSGTALCCIRTRSMFTILSQTTEWCRSFSKATLTHKQTFVCISYSPSPPIKNISSVMTVHRIGKKYTELIIPSV